MRRLRSRLGYDEELVIAMVGLAHIADTALINTDMMDRSSDADSQGWDRVGTRMSATDLEDTSVHLLVRWNYDVIVVQVQVVCHSERFGDILYQHFRPLAFILFYKLIFLLNNYNYLLYNYYFAYLQAVHVHGFKSVHTVVFGMDYCHLRVIPTDL